MKLGVRTKLFLVSLGLIAGTLLLADLFITRSLDRLLTDRIREDLLVRTELVEREASALADQNAMSTSGAYERLAQDLALRARARVTLISLDGLVLGDSEVAGQALGALENHRERPEVVDALARGQGSAVRYSDTLRQRMMYTALPFHRRGSTSGVARLAFPLATVDAAVTQVRKVLLAASLAALALAALGSTLLSQRLSRTLRRLTRAAGHMAGGNLEARTRTAGSDEIAILGQSLDQLAENLATALNTLKAERDLLGDVLNGMHEGVLLLDRDGRIVHLNPALRAMLLLRADAAGKPLLEVIRNAQLMALVERAKGNHEDISGEIELSGIKPRRFLAHASRLPGDPGKLLVVLVDVTELRRLESLRKEFVANASHELRTPVASMRSAAETLRTAIDDPGAARTFLEIIERNAARLQNLVEDLLDLSRIESREFRLERESLDLAPFLESMSLPYRRDAEAGGRILLLDPSLEGLAVRADRRALEQILGNLLDNALKYCPKGAQIRVHGSREGDSVRLSVEDTGPGIAPEHLPRLFERFYRVDAGRSRELGGTGLGLAIVKHLTEAMGGTASVESEPGRGSRFTVTLPKG